MKTIIKNVIDFKGDIVEIILPPYSAFVVTVYQTGIRINYGDEVIAQQHIHSNLDDREAEVNAAMDTAYRQAMLYLAFNNPFSLSAFYRHVVRHYTDNTVKPSVWPTDKEYVTGILNMTTRANDVTVIAVAETELNDATEKEFTLCLTHDGDLFTHDGTSFQIELANVLTGLPVLGHPELSNAAN